MKRIEKEIKKNSQELIESSLPEISSLDHIPIKTKKNKDLPFYFAPLGMAALAIVAIMIPIAMRKQAAPVKPGESVTSINNSQPPHIIDSNNGHATSDVINKPTYNFNFENYKPTFNNLNEAIYYSYLAFHQESDEITTSNALLRKEKKFLIQDEEVEEENIDTPESQKYVDEYGRTHHPISLDTEFVFSHFLYFEFDTKNNEFLEQRIGNGHIYGLSVETNIGNNNETMLILKKGEYFYSCLSNGAGSHAMNGPSYVEFSAHKTIEGFDLVKDVTNKRYLTISCDPVEDYYVNYGKIRSITIEDQIFSINPNTVFYDPTPVRCDMDELKELLEINPNFEIVDSYGGLDALVYDATLPETNSFTMNEFEGTFNVSEDKLYLNNKEVVNLNGANKIYASEMNKDGHRDIVFESIEDSARMFNIYDINRNRYIYHKAVTDIGDYDYYLAMRDNRLVVNLYEPGFVNDENLLDYGYFAYSGNNDATIIWQNLYGLYGLSIKGVYEADGITPIEYYQTHYLFNSKTPYIIEMELGKFNENKLGYPSLASQVKCTPLSDITNMPNKSPTWAFLSMENGIYRYQITFQESGYSYYKLSFYRFKCDLRAAVDVVPHEE